MEKKASQEEKLEKELEEFEAESNQIPQHQSTVIVNDVNDVVEDETNLAESKASIAASLNASMNASVKVSDSQQDSGIGNSDAKGIIYKQSYNHK